MSDFCVVGGAEAVNSDAAISAYDNWTQMWASRLSLAEGFWYRWVSRPAYAGSTNLTEQSAWSLKKKKKR